MKKQFFKNKSIFAVILMFFVLATLFVGCNFEKQALKKVDLKFDVVSNTVKWQAVDNALEYGVIVNDSEAVFVNDTFYQLKGYSGEVKVKVFARGDLNLFTNSEYALLTVNIDSQIAKPVVNAKISAVGNKITITINWNKSDFAKNYSILIYKKEVIEANIVKKEDVTENNISYTITDTNETYIIKVKANSNNEEFIKSSEYGETTYKYYDFMPTEFKYNYTNEGKYEFVWDYAKEENLEYNLYINKGAATEKVFNSKTDATFKGNYFTVSAAVGDVVNLGVIKNGIENMFGTALVIEEIDQALRPIIEKNFYFAGKKYDYYIDSADEFETFVHYLLLTEDNTTEQNFYINYYNFEDTVKSVGAMFDSYYLTFREALKLSTNIKKINSNYYSIKVTFTCKGLPMWKTTGADAREYPQYPDITPKYVGSNMDNTLYPARVSTFDNFALEKTQKQGYVQNSIDMYMAIENGYKPLFYDTPASLSAKSCYNDAKTILKEIISDNMTELQKVTAIFDWISYNVKYDYGVTDLMGTISSNNSEYNKFYKNYAFYAEGVFNNRLAVCNGLSAAVVIMCGLEGIDSYKIGGRVSNGAHAWNKIKVDGAWYLSDPTWGNPQIKINGADYEIINREYLLGASNQPCFTHNNRTENTEEDLPQIECKTNFDFQKANIFTFNSKTYDHYLNSNEEVDALLNYYNELSQKTSLTSFDVVFANSKIKGYFDIKYKNLTKISVTPLFNYERKDKVLGSSVMVCYYK
ncbi:MAG: transglutaminase domain-containing protein, partial [Clostridia bacterium]